RQGAIWYLVARPRMGRSHDDAALSGQSAHGARRAPAYATHVRRRSSSDCQRVGVSQRAPGTYPLSPTTSWGLSLGEWGHRIVEQVHLSCAAQALRSVVV